MGDQMVSFSSPSINFAVAPDSPHYGLSTASPRTYSSESLSSPPISDISELEDCDSMSLDDQLNSLSELRIQDLKTATDMKHPDYYITGGDVVFLVGMKLFRVHRHFFVRESAKFKELLTSQTLTRNGSELVGSSDSRPIHMHDITAEEFESFLWVFYNEEYRYNASVDRWTAILRLAHLWKFPKMKDFAVQELDKLQIPPADKILMATIYETDPSYGWLEKAYAALGAREAPISKAEGDKLGLDTVLHLAELREKIRKRRFEEKTMSVRDGESDTQSESPYTANNVGDKYNNSFGPTYPYSQAPTTIGWNSSGPGGWGQYRQAPAPPQPLSQYTKPPYPCNDNYMQQPQQPPVAPPKIPDFDYYSAHTVQKSEALSTVTEDAAEDPNYTDEDVADARSIFCL